MNISLIHLGTIYEILVTSSLLFIMININCFLNLKGLTEILEILNKDRLEVPSMQAKKLLITFEALLAPQLPSERSNPAQQPFPSPAKGPTNPVKKL